MTVQFSYYFGGLKTAESKVYGESVRRFPSGFRKCYKVWNNDRQSMEWVKADSCQIK